MVGLVSYGCLKLKKFEHEERFAKLQLIDWKVSLWVEATKTHRKVGLEDASMVDVMADVSVKDKAGEDGCNLLRALSVQKFNPEVKLRLMLLRPEIKERVVNAWIDGEHCFSVDEMKAVLVNLP